MVCHRYPAGRSYIKPSHRAVEFGRNTTSTFSQFVHPNQQSRKENASSSSSQVSPRPLSAAGPDGWHQGEPAVFGNDELWDGLVSFLAQPTTPEEGCIWDSTQFPGTDN